MLLGALQLIVGLVGASALGLAWCSRERRTEAFVFGGIGCVCTIIVAVGFFSRSGWLTWALGIVACLGLLIGVSGVLMAGAITRGINSMVVRDFEQGQPIRMDGGARVARVGSLIIRHLKTEPLGRGGYAVTLRASLLETEQPPTEVILCKSSDLRAAEAVIGTHRIQLVDVAGHGNKSSLFTSTVVVTDASEQGNTSSEAGEL